MKWEIALYTSNWSSRKRRKKNEVEEIFEQVTTEKATEEMILIFQK